MQSIPFHIAYLLTRHECVIVPGMGAFVVSSFGGEKVNRWRILSPPEAFLGFNSEITHNDGLLSTSLAKEKKISYTEANLLIEQYVTNILQSMKEGKQVHIPWVGDLCLKDNKKLFQPEKTVSCNAFNYGLVNFSAPYLKDIQNSQQKTTSLSRKKNKEIVWIPVSRKFITYTGSIAAALALMCIIPTPLNNSHRTQYASIITLPVNNEIKEEKAISTIETEKTAAADSTLFIQKETETPPSEVTTPVKAVEFYYYIIIASLPDQASAEKTLTAFQSKGFENAAILSSGERRRIYANRFENKTEAEKALIQFRKDYPANANAWLLKN